MLLDDLVLRDRTLEKFRRSLRTLSRFAVNYRYPGANASKREAVAALRIAQRLCDAIRDRLGI